MRAGGDVGYCEHALHAAAGVRACRVPVVVAHGLLRHVLLEHLHVHHRLLRFLCPRVSFSRPCLAFISWSLGSYCRPLHADLLAQ